jgi:translation initiation factor 3 subunit B
MDSDGEGFPNVYDAVRDELEDYGDGEEILDFVSEGFDEADANEAALTLDESFPLSVFIAGAPPVGQDKYSRLMNVLNKHIEKCGPSTEKHMPIDPETGTTGGWLIATFEDQSGVDSALSYVHGLKFDKKHVLTCVRIDDFDEVAGRDSEFRLQRTLTAFSRADARLWLSDKKCREQLLLRYQAETEIYWHDTMAGMPVLCYGAEREKAAGKIWCDWRVQWSPQGTYLATFHQQGIVIWGGEGFEKKRRLPHANTKAILFSPDEEYIMLWNGSLPPTSGNTDQVDQEAYAMYHILTGVRVKTHRTPVVTPFANDSSRSDSEKDFPHFLWSADGKYYAECNQTRIMVRDTETFELIKDAEGKQTALKYPELSTFQWSPRDNIIAVWTLETDHNPARLVLVEIPSRRELASRSRTQCEATMYWQSEGDYLCLLVKKLTKTKKTTSTNLEIFRMRQRGIPVDSVTISDTVRGFFWECKGNRFAVITADEAGLKPKLLVYALQKEKVEEICNFDLPSNSFDSIFWAPDGQYFVVAACSGSGGDLLFCGLTADNRLEILYKDEHYMLNCLQWDPSSRYMITAVTQEMDNSMSGYKYSMEAGYSIRTFQGRVLYRTQKEKLYQACWRPRPTSLLQKDKQDNIRKKIKEYSKRYDALDEQAKEAARSAFRRERQEKTDAFVSVLRRLEEFWTDSSEKNGWEEARDAFEENQGWEEDPQIILDELDVTEELISQ